MDKITVLIMTIFADWNKHKSGLNMRTKAILIQF